MVLWPHRGRIACIDTGEEYNPWAPDDVELLKTFYEKPNIPCNMTILYWNVRGIARPSFKPNLRPLFSQRHPEMVVLVEMRVCHAKSSLILKRISFDSWHLVELRGFLELLSSFGTPLVSSSMLWVVIFKECME